MIWVLIAYWGAAMIGIVGAGWFETPLTDQEQVMPLLARELLPGWIAGLMLAGAIAAMMSTADSQLIIVTSSVVEDFYVKLLKELIGSEYAIESRDQARDFFTRVTSLYKNWNYAAPESPDYERYRGEIAELASQHRAGGGAPEPS